MNKLIPFRHLAIAFFSCLLAASCSIDDDTAALPDGKYPMTFTAQVDGLNVTRATGKDTWTGNDKIAVSIDGGSNHKTYKITNTTTGAMSPDDAANTLYWQKNRGQRIQAWFPVSATATISDQSSGFSSYDYLVSDGTYNYTASGVKLPFTHAMAKVKYTLQKGDGISDSDLSSAAVQIYGYTEVSFTNGTLSGNTEGWITPHADREALVVPLQLQRQQFIKVTIGINDAARDYYYTPTDINLEAGKQYSYTITVKKEGLVVEGISASWTDSDLGTPEATEKKD
ncbi:MAG: fimbrillin family protein [Parabacteroides gordonii]|uniref:fimbrillin family protein n=1 Tax=Parabacteroides gordonii TaxID=574930 RepID=UPI003A8AA7D8